jgi:hypothetical protein
MIAGAESVDKNGSEMLSSSAEVTRHEPKN